MGYFERAIEYERKGSNEQTSFICVCLYFPFMQIFHTLLQYYTQNIQKIDIS